MATRTWTSNSSTNMNLATNYDGTGVLTGEELVFNGTGSAVAISTATVTVASITVSGTGSITISNTLNLSSSLSLGGSGTISISGACNLSGSTLTIANGPTYTLGTISATSPTLAFTLGTSLSINNIATITAGQVITWNTGSNILTMSVNTAAPGNATTNVVWVSSTPGTPYRINYSSATAQIAAGLTVTDCINTGTLVNATGSNNINGGNNTGFNIYQAISLVDPSLAATATDVNGGESWAKAMGTINRGSLTAPETRLLASPDTAFTGLTFACAKGTAATPNRYLYVASGNLSSFGALIADCLSTSGWIANPAGDVGLSYLVATHTKNGTGNKMKLTFDAVPQANTMQAYCPVANLSLAAFQNVCSFMQDYVGTCPANSLVIKLCTGNDGVTGVVATMTWAEAMAALSVNTPVCLNNGAALANGINSIAIYTGAVAPAASSVWAFDTFYATIAGFDLNSVLHKSYNYRGVAWAANTAIALNEIRVPTFAARSPLVYKCAFAGTTGATEYFTDADGTSKPIWDKAILTAMGDFPNQTLLDGTCVWEVLGDDEAFYFMSIKSLDVAGNRIEVDNHPANVGNAGRGYYGTDETVAMSYLTPYLYPMAAAAATVMDSVGASGTDASPRLISGGWTSPGGVDTVTGMTFISGRNGLGKGLSCVSRLSTKLSGIGWVRTGIAVEISSNPNWTLLRMVVGLSLTTYMINQGSITSAILIMQYCYGVNAGVSGSFLINRTIFRGSFNNKVIGCLSTANNNPAAQFEAGCAGMQRGFEASNNAGYGIMTSPGMVFINCKTTLNAVAPFSSTNTTASRCKNLSSSESIIIQTAAATYGYGAGMLIQNFNGIIGDNRAYYPSMGQATYNSTTHVWTIAVNSVNATQQIPLRHKVGSIRVTTANVVHTVSISAEPTNVNLAWDFKILANTIAGVQQDTVGVMTAIFGTLGEKRRITFTPMETGWVDLFIDCWLTNTTLTYTIAYNLDSLSAIGNSVTFGLFGVGDQLFGEEYVQVRGEAISFTDEAIRNTTPGTSAVTSGVSWQYLNNTQIGTANNESHTANQVLHSAGGNYIDEDLDPTSVYSGIVFGLSLTGTDLGEDFNTNPGTSAVALNTNWLYLNTTLSGTNVGADFNTSPGTSAVVKDIVWTYLNNSLTGTAETLTPPIAGAQLLYGYVFSVMNNPINNASVSMHIKSIPEIIDTLILTAKDSNTTTNSSGYFEIQAIIGSEIEIIIKDQGMVLYQNTITVTSDTTKDLSTYSLV